MFVSLYIDFLEELAVNYMFVRRKRNKNKKTKKKLFKYHTCNIEGPESIPGCVQISE